MGHKKICLVESDQKKCTFLREVAMLCEIEVSIFNSRIENLEYKDVDLIMSRALAPLSKLIDYVELFIDKSPSKKKTFPNMLFLKGKSYKYELVELSKTKNIDYKVYQSITDEFGKIIYINKVNVLNIINEKKIK